MKRFLVFVSGILATASLCPAATCTTGTLASYIALGSTGCTIGTNTLFNFHVVSGTAGATPISQSSLAISPVGGSSNPGFTASTTATAQTGMLLEAIFSYELSGSLYTRTSITLSNSSETGDGAVTDIQNYCLGGTFGPSGVTGCTGTPGNLLTLDGIANQDSASFASRTLLSLTDDFTLDGGLIGSASGGSFTDQFTAVTAVPEPVSFALAGLALIFAVGVKFRSRHRRAF